MAKSWLLQEKGMKVTCFLTPSTHRKHTCLLAFEQTIQCSHCSWEDSFEGSFILRSAPTILLILLFSYRNQWHDETNSAQQLSLLKVVFEHQGSKWPLCTTAGSKGAAPIGAAAARNVFTPTFMSMWSSVMQAVRKCWACLWTLGLLHALCSRFCFFESGLHTLWILVFISGFAITKMPT